MPRLRIQRFDVVRYGWVLAVIVVFSLVYSNSCQRIPVLTLAGADLGISAWAPAQGQDAGTDTVQVGLTLTLTNPSSVYTATVRSAVPSVEVDGAPVHGAAVTSLRATSIQPGTQSGLALTLTLPAAGLPAQTRAALAAGGIAVLEVELELEVAVSTVVDVQTITLAPLPLGPLLGAPAP